MFFDWSLDFWLINFWSLTVQLQIFLCQGQTVLLMLGDLSLRRTGTNGCEDSVVIRLMIDVTMIVFMIIMKVMIFLIMIKMIMIDHQGGGEHTAGAVRGPRIPCNCPVVQSPARGLCMSSYLWEMLGIYWGLLEFISHLGADAHRSFRPASLL